jgi:hypothetical protein
MTEPMTPWRFPWGLMVTAALLAVLAAISMGARLASTVASPEIWLAPAICVSAVFLTLQQLQNYFWGIVAALSLMFHPAYWQWAPVYPSILLAEVAELLILAAVVVACGLVYQPHWAWRSWLVLAPLTGIACGVAWQAVPTSGLAISLLPLVVLPLVAAHALGRRRRPDKPAPCAGNVVAGLGLGLFGPAVGLLWGYLAEPGGLSLSQIANSLELRQPITTLELEKCFWPTPWAVVPLAVWGLWRTFRRGRSELARRKAPAAWALTLFALLNLLAAGLMPGDNCEMSVLSLATVAVLLGVFGVADVFRNIWDQLRLAPPGERVGEDTPETNLFP